MAIYDFFLSRNNAASTPANYIGHKGRLFYNDADGLFRLSDGVTPGGKVVANLALASTGTTAPINPFPGELWYNPTTKELFAYNNGAFRGTVNVATTSTLGGIKAGPGVVIASDGALSLDSTGIPFNFGDFYAFTNPGPSDGACLSSINLNQDVNIVSNGTGSVNVVGSFQIHRTDGDLESALTSPPVFAVSSDGDISATSLDIQETNDLGLMAALNVTINEQGLTKTPAVVSGSVAQFTGRDNRNALLVVDTYGIDVASATTGGQLVFRTGRGTNNTTTSVLAGDKLGEVVAAGWASNGYGGLAVGGLRILANENFTPTARGGKLELFVVSTGTTATTTVATVDQTGIVMGAGKTLRGTATTATNLAAATGILAGSLSVDPVSIPANTAAVQTFTLNGLTTSHKIVITSGTALGYGLSIGAAWASALNTISIEFHNVTNQPIDPTAKTIQYFAWV